MKASKDKKKVNLKVIRFVFLRNLVDSRNCPSQMRFEWNLNWISQGKLLSKIKFHTLSGPDRRHGHFVDVLPAYSIA